jgi:5-formyltetrahydrofolate cyclo-ligase
VNSGALKKAKRQVRRQVLAARDAMPPARRAAAGELVTMRFLALPEVGGARTVMLFWSFGSEVPTEGSIRSLHAKGTVVALPRIANGELVPVRYAPGDPTEPTTFGAQEPADGTVVEPARIDVVAVPGVAFDRRGGRIGYGGGYYDRFLRGLAVYRVGLAFALQVLEQELPGGLFDLGVDAIVTETETVRCSDLNSRSSS